MNNVMLMRDGSYTVDAPYGRRHVPNSGRWAAEFAAIQAWCANNSYTMEPEPPPQDPTQVQVERYQMLLKELQKVGSDAAAFKILADAGNTEPIVMSYLTIAANRIHALAKAADIAYRASVGGLTGSDWKLVTNNLFGQSNSFNGLVSPVAVYPMA